MPPYANTQPRKTGRKRRFIGWSLIALSVLLTFVWTASAFTTPRVGTRTVKAAVHRGYLYAFVSNRSYYNPSLRGGRHVLLSDEVWDGLEQDPPGLDLLSSDPALTIRINSASFGSLFPWVERSSVILPLWVLWTAGFVAGAILIWFGRTAALRARKGFCPKCGYSLAGLAMSANCPECGAAEAKSQTNAD